MEKKFTRDLILQALVDMQEGGKITLPVIYTVTGVAGSNFISVPCLKTSLDGTRGHHIVYKKAEISELHTTAYDLLTYYQNVGLGNRGAEIVNKMVRNSLDGRLPSSDLKLSLSQFLEIDNKLFEVSKIYAQLPRIPEKQSAPYTLVPQFQVDGRIASMPTGTGIDCIKFLKVNNVIGKLVKAWLEHEIAAGNFSDEDKHGKTKQLEELFTRLEIYSKMVDAEENGDNMANMPFIEADIVSLIGDLFEVDLTTISPLKPARVKKFKLGHPLVLPEDGLTYSTGTSLTSAHLRKR